MKAFPILAAILFGCFGVIAHAVDIVTIEGDAYKGAEITAIDRYEIKLSYDAGLATLRLASLPDEIIAQYAPKVDRSKDGRFWFERSQAIYEGWRRKSATSSQTVEEAMQPVVPHRAEIAQYLVVLAHERQVAAARQQDLADRSERDKRAEIKNRLQYQEMFSNPYVVEMMLKDALQEQYIRQQLTKP